MITWEWDLEAGRLRSSGNATELLGWRRGEAKNFDDRVHPDDRERHRAALSRTMATGEPYCAEFRFVRPDGRVIWLRDEAVFEKNEDGRRVLKGTTAEITASKPDEPRRETEEAEPPKP